MSKNSGSLLFVSTFFIFCVFFLIIERYYKSSDVSIFFSALSCMALMVYLILEFKKYRDHFFTYFYQFAYFFGLLLSSILISSGAYMVEIQRLGTPNGVFWMIMIFLILGYESSKASYYFSKKHSETLRSPKIKPSLEKAFSFALVAIALLLCIFILFRYSSPVLLGIERASFWNGVVPNVYSFIPSLVIQTFFFAIAIFFANSSLIMKRASLGVIITYLLLTFIVLGQKYSAFVSYGMIFLLFIASRDSYLRVSPKLVFLAVGTIGILIYLIVLSYHVIGRDAWFILARIALQGQLTWSTLELPDFPFFSNAPPECFFRCGPFETGADFISFEFLPSSVYYHYSEGGTGLSGFMPALPIYTLGLPVALLLHVVFSSIGGVLQAYIVRQINRNSIIFSFLVYKIHFALVLFWYAGIYLGQFFLVSIIICVGALLVHYNQKEKDYIVLSK